MSIKHSNNFTNTLSGAIASTGATSMTLTSVTGAPTVGSGQNAYFTITDGINYEIVLATALATNTYTITRAQQGSTARTWASGAMVQCNVTADSLDRKLDAPSSIANYAIFAGPATTYGQPQQVSGAGASAGDVLTYVDSTSLPVWSAPTSGVVSVNGKTGSVTLTQDDVGDGATYKQYSATEKSKLAGIASGAEVNTVSSVNSSTGAVVLNQDNILDGATYKQYSATEKTKLAGIQSAADVTSTTNVVSALTAASLPAVTIANNDKVVIQDTNNSNSISSITTQAIRDLAPTTGVTGTGVEVHATSPTLVTPILGVADATSINFGQDPLSYYDEGTFSPTITASTVGDLSVAYTNQVGTYTRIGALVQFVIRVDFTPTFTTASGVIRIAGLPFPVSTTVPTSLHAAHVAGISAMNWGTGKTQLTAVPTAGQTYIGINIFQNGSAGGNLLFSAVTSGVANYFYLSGVYTV